MAHSLLIWVLLGAFLRPNYLFSHGKLRNGLKTIDFSSLSRVSASQRFERRVGSRSRGQPYVQRRPRLPSLAPLATQVSADQLSLPVTTKTRRWRKLQSRRFLVGIRQDLIIAEFALKLSAGRVGGADGAPFPNVPTPNYKNLYLDLTAIREIALERRKDLSSGIEDPEELQSFFDRLDAALQGLERIVQEAGTKISANSSKITAKPTSDFPLEENPKLSDPAAALSTVHVSAPETKESYVGSPKSYKTRKPKFKRIPPRRSGINPVSPTVDASRSAGEEKATESKKGKSAKEMDEETGEVPPQEAGSELRVILREDGTVDWDGVIEGGKEVAQFGADLWRRLNAKGPGEEGTAAERGAALVRVDQNPRVRSMYESLQVLQAEYEKMVEMDAETLRLSQMRMKLRLKTLEFDMERLSTFIENEIEQGTISAESERLLIAEYGLLDMNVVAMVENFEKNVADFKKGENPNELVDADELKVLESQVKSFKDRIGFTPSTLLPPLDLSSVTKFVKDTGFKLKMALQFYTLGTKLLGNDIQYSLWLIGKAFNGDTLKAREARMLQRTAKDISTLIPFTIILLIPLTPVGHVLVFSAIQKYFPNFYPSPYTERRQNLVRLYQEIEGKLDDENRNESNDETSEETKSEVEPDESKNK